MYQRQLLVGLIVFSAAACGGGGGNGKGASSGSDESGDNGGDNGGGEGSGEGDNGAAPVKVKAPKVGTKALERRFVSLDFELTLTKDKAAGGMQAGSWSIEEERSYEVLGADDSAITKLSLAYGRREAKALLGVEETAATAAHSYVVESKGGSVSISPTKSKDIKTEEKEAVNSEYDWVGQPSPLLSWLENGEIASGKKREGGAAETRALLGAVPSSNPTTGKVKVTSKGRTKGDRPALALDVEAQVQIVSGETVFDLSLKGPARIDLETGWVADLDLSGEAKASGRLKHKKGMLDVSGTAKAVLKRSMSF
jgi:hypothetical protein